MSAFNCPNCGQRNRLTPALVSELREDYGRIRKRLEDRMQEWGVTVPEYLREDPKTERLKFLGQLIEVYEIQCGRCHREMTADELFRLQEVIRAKKWWQFWKWNIWN